MPGSGLCRAPAIPKFAIPIVNGPRSLSRRNHEGHEGHEEMQAVLRVLRALRGAHYAR